MDTKCSYCYDIWPIQICYLAVQNTNKMSGMTPAKILNNTAEAATQYKMYNTKENRPCSADVPSLEFLDGSNKSRM